MTPWKRRFLLETIVWDVMLNAGSLSGWKSIVICRAQLPSPCLKATESQVFYDCLRSFSQLWKNSKTSLSNENCWSSSVKHLASKCFKNSGTEAFLTLGLKWNRWKSLGCQTFFLGKRNIIIMSSTLLGLLLLNFFRPVGKWARYSFDRGWPGFIPQQGVLSLVRMLWSWAMDFRAPSPKFFRILDGINRAPNSRWKRICGNFSWQV